MSHWTQKIGQGLCGLALLMALCVGASAQDARAILQKTMTAYQNLRSYSGRAAVTNQTIYNGSVVKEESFSVTLKTRAPNRLLLEMTTPHGSRHISSDGQQFSVYGVSENQLSRFPAVPDRIGTLNLLVQHAHVFAFLDPLFFLYNTKLPGELTDLKVKSSTNYNGHAVYIISAVTRAKEKILKAQNGRTIKIPGETRTWNWWIDRGSGLLYKIESRAENVPFPVLKRNGNKVTQATVPTTSFTRHIVTELQANPALNENTFRFVTPAGVNQRPDWINGK